MDAGAWLAADESLIDRDRWTPPPQRTVVEAEEEVRSVVQHVMKFAGRYLKERSLLPTTVHNYQGLLTTRINPYFADMPLKNVTLSEITRGGPRSTRRPRRRTPPPTDCSAPCSSPPRRRS
jgi:hypothetical protein